MPALSGLRGRPAVRAPGVSVTVSLPGNRVTQPCTLCPGAVSAPHRPAIEEGRRMGSAATLR